MKMKDQLDSPQPMKKPKAKAKKAEVKKKKQAKLKAKKAEKDKKALKKEAPIATKKNKKSAKADKKDDKNKTLTSKSLKAEAPDTTEIPSEIKNTVTTSSSVETSVDTTVIAQPVAVADNDESMTQQKTESQAEPNVDSISPTLTHEPKPTQSPRRRTRATRRKPSVEDIQALADNANRQRASKNLASLTEQEQNIATQDVVKRLLMGEISQGTALRELRVKVLGLRQEAYTELTGVSRKTLSEVENDKGNYTSEIINKMFKPFQLKVSLVPESSEDLKTILNQK